jgi:hypothetical protein
MIFSALFSFFGGTAFRMIWGELSSFFNKKQDHANEMDRMEFQAKQDALEHERNLESISLQADLGVKTIQVQAQSAIGQIETEGWLEAIKATSKPSGIPWIDGWNATIRPAVATWAIFIITLGEFAVIVLSPTAISVASAALGLYLADRTLMKRGK